HRFEVSSVVRGVALSPDGLRALSGSEDNLVRLWDVQTGKDLGRLPGRTHGVISVAYSPDGLRALSGSFDNTLRLWDLKDRKQLHRLEGHTGHVTAVAFAPDGRHALSGNGNLHKGAQYGHARDYDLRLWDLQEGKEVRRFPGHVAPVWGVTFSA